MKTRITERLHSTLKLILIIATATLILSGLRCACSFARAEGKPKCMWLRFQAHCDSKCERELCEASGGGWNPLEGSEVGYCCCTPAGRGWYSLCSVVPPTPDGGSR